MRKLKNIIRNSKSYKLIKKSIIAAMYYLPINSKKVIFDNFGGRGYGDDPKYIAEYLRENAPDLKLIWLSSDKNDRFPKGITSVKYGTISAAFQYSTAKVWVDNIKNSIKPKKKKTQFYIQTWHSTLGFKKNEADVDNLPGKYVIAAKADAQMTNLMYSNNDFRKKIYENKYWYSGPVLKCSVPRNTVLFNVSEDIREKVYDYFNIERNKKIILYAPTFRKERNIDMFNINYKSIIAAVEKKFDSTFVCLVRLHPNDSNSSNGIEYSEGVKNASFYPDMQELLAVSEMLITDYSGCMFDFSFTRKPVFLYVSDLENYLKKERTLHFSFDNVPFSKAETVDELINNINEFEDKKYQKDCELFFERIGLDEDGTGSETIGKIIIDKCRG